MGPGAGEMHSARQISDIQRRVDALYAESGHPANAYPYHVSGPYGQPPVQGFDGVQTHPAMYADSHAAANIGTSADLEELKYNMEQLHSRIMGMEARNQPQSSDTNANEKVIQQIHGLKETIASLSQKNSQTGELATLQGTINEMSTSFREFANQMSQNTVEPKRLTQMIESSHSNLLEEIGNLRQVVSKDANDSSNVLPKMIEASHNELKSQIDHMQNAFFENLGTNMDEVGRLSASQQTMLTELDGIKTVVQNSLLSPDRNDQEEFNKIEMRLEEVTRAIVALSHGGGSVDQLERVEARLSDLTKQLESIGSGAVTANTASYDNEFNELKARLNNMGKQLVDLENSNQFDVLTQKLDSMMAEQLVTSAKANGTANAPSYGEEFNEIKSGLNQLADQISHTNHSEQFNHLAQKLDALLQNVSESSPQSVDTQGIEEMLARFEIMLKQNEQQAISNQPMPELANQLQKLESILLEKSGAGDIARYLEDIDGRLAEMANKFGDNTGFSELQQKLISIEEQVANSREVAIELANEVAGNAVDQAIGHMGEHPGTPASGIDESALNNLMQNMQAIKDSSSQNNTETLRSFDVVRTSLETIANRLGKLETTIEATAQQGTESLHQHQNQTDFHAANLVDGQAERLPETQADEFATGGEFLPEFAQELGQEKLDHYQTVLGDERQPQEEKLNPYNFENLQVDALPSGKGNDENRSTTLEESIDKHVSQNTETMEVLPEVDTPPIMQEPFTEDSSDSEDEIPLAPGTAEPDLAALLNQAKQQQQSKPNSAFTGQETTGSDFIAAARRAAQAAAQSAENKSGTVAENLNDGKHAAEETTEKTSGWIERNKKNLVIGTVALLLTAIAIPLTGKLMSSSIKPAHVKATTGTDHSVTQGQTGKNNDATTEKVEETPAVKDVTGTLVAEDTNGTAEQQAALSESPVKDVTPPANSNPLPKPTSDLGAQYVSEVAFGPDALKSAVADSNPEAWFEIGRRYMEGQGTAKDLKKAAVWFERAGHQNVAPAQYLVGNFAEKGFGMDRDLNKAVDWYKKAAENGNVVAMHNLAVIYATPGALSEKPDMDMAFKWFTIAARYGVRDSQVNLGIFYTKGIATDSDLVEAYKWFAIAAKSGDKDAEKKRQIISESLRPDLLETAKAEVEKWRPAEIDQAANHVAPNAEWMSDLASKPVAASKQTILQAQKILSSMGFDAGPADGIIGGKTRQAIANFQQKYGLKVSGQITTEFLRKLEETAS